MKVKEYEQYMSNSEYESHFEKLSGLRSRIASDLPIKSGIYILDIATGEGYFAIEVAKRDSSLNITGIDISQRAIRQARKNIEKQNLQDRIGIVEMDSTKMRFHKEKFDMAINFTGLDEIYMTRGKEGVQKTFLEVNRVLKPKAYFCFVVMPPEEMETKTQKLEVALWNYICGARYLSGEEYENMVIKARFKLIGKKNYYSGMRFTPQQTKNEIRYIIETVPEIYGINVPTFKEIWAKFGKEIEKNGLGCYSKCVMIVAQKVGDV